LSGIHPEIQVLLIAAFEPRFVTLFVIVKRERIRELLILQHAKRDHQSRVVKSGPFGKQKWSF
jgi:hypothetical protein